MPFGFNGNYDDPSITGDLLELYFGAREQTGSPSTDNEDIWVATRNDRDGPWSDVRPVAELSTPETETGVSVSFDGLTIVFAREVDGRGTDLFIATRTERSEPWNPPVEIAELNTAAVEAPGQLSLDGTTLYFASNRAGDFDIYRSIRPDSSSSFYGSAAVAVASVAGRDELSPSISADDTELTFAAADMPPFLELYVSRRVSGEPFVTAELIGELNSPNSESDLRLGPSGRFAVMASDRTAVGRNRIWTTSR